MRRSSSRRHERLPGIQRTRGRQRRRCVIQRKSTHRIRRESRTTRDVHGIPQVRITRRNYRPRVNKITILPNIKRVPTTRRRPRFRNRVIIEVRGFGPRWSVVINRIPRHVLLACTTVRPHQTPLHHTMRNTHRITRPEKSGLTRIGIPHRSQRHRHRRRRIKIRRRSNRRPLKPHTRNLDRTLQINVVHALFAQRIRIRENKIGFANGNGQRARRNSRGQRTRASIQRI